LKIDFPPGASKSLVGLILGPRGSFQKKLEEESGCKILIRGGAQNKEVHGFNNDFMQEEAPHVVLLADQAQKLSHAK
jgi:far upstream element-binding protein